MVKTARWLGSVVIGLMLVAILAWSAFGQTVKDVMGNLQPFVIDITQSVPVQVSIPMTGENPVTVTMPLTVSVNLRVRVDTAARQAKVEALPATTPVIAVATVTPEAKAGSNDLAPGVPRIESKDKPVVTLAGIALDVDSVRLRPYAEVMKVNKDLAKAISQVKGFDGSTVFGTISLVITNTTDSKMRVDPADGTLVVNGEQVQLSNYFNYSSGLNGKIFSGVTKKGVLYFVLKETRWEDIAKGTSFVFDAGKPIGDNDFMIGDNNFEFKLKLEPSQ